MKLRIDPIIFEKFIGVNIGVVVAKGVDNSTGKFPGLEMGKTEERIREKFTLESLIKDPRIDCWRKAYSAFGAKPKEHTPSIENLYRTALNGSGIRSVNKLVDIYNFVSIKHILPAGGEDLDKIEGDIHLAFAGPNEPPVVLLGEKEARPPHPNEVIYKDEVSAICRRWNWKEADRTKLTKETKNCILVLEGISPITENDVRIALEELKGLVERFCGGRAYYNLLNRRSNEIIV